MSLRNRITFAFLIWLFFNGCSSAQDVNSVLIRGDGTNIGMKIKNVVFNKDAFLISTTGARFEYIAGTLKIYQGLGDELSRRLICSIKIKRPEVFENVESNEDHVLLSAKNINIGIYGDSTCILAPKTKTDVSFEGNFKPDYEGRHKDSFVLIDNTGGIGIYPQRHESGYKTGQVKLGEKNWSVNYQLNPNQRVMISTFPPRKFDFEKSCRNRIAHTGGIFIKKTNTSTGILPSDDVIKQWGKYINIICIHCTGLYPHSGVMGRSSYSWFSKRIPGMWSFGGPYKPVKPSELHRVVKTAHSLGMKVVVYSSPFYYYKSNDADAFFDDVKQIVTKYNLDGMYVDSPYRDKVYPTGAILDDKIKGWELMRRIRQLIGPDGILYYHGSGDRSPVAAVPNIDALCDFTLYGENVPFNSFKDDYIQYQVRKFGISNTIGMIKADRKPPGMNNEEIIRQMLAMNGRMRWGTYPKVKDDGSYSWPTTPPVYLQLYYKKLNSMLLQYRIKTNR